MAAKDPVREGLEGVDVGDDDAAPGLLAAARRRLRDVRRLLGDPAGWSARRYRAKNTMELDALHPERWRRPERDDAE